MQSVKKTAKKRWRWLLIAAVLAICITVAIPLTKPDRDSSSKAGNGLQPEKLTLRQRDQLQPEAAIRSTMGEPIALLEAVALYMAIENTVAAGRHVDDILENWDEVDLCRLAWPAGAHAIAGNDALHHCVVDKLAKAPRQQYGDQFLRDQALQEPYAALNEVTITALDPASWYPQLAYVTAPCRAGYRAYARSVHTTLVDRMSVWEFVKDQFNYCVLQHRKDAVEPSQTTTVTPTAPPGLTPQIDDLAQ